LNGAPGIYSARYAGLNATDEENNDLLLRQLKRSAFRKKKSKVCMCGCPCKKGTLLGTFYGECYGYIATEYKGENGFGYDPIFMFSDGRHMAELTPEEKIKLAIGTMPW